MVRNKFVVDSYNEIVQQENQMDGNMGLNQRFFKVGYQ
jgi:hypothetical protein